MFIQCINYNYCTIIWEIINYNIIENKNNLTNKVHLIRVAFNILSISFVV